MGYEFKNLRTAGNVARGVAEYFLFAPKNWFEINGIKSPVAPFTSQGDQITIKTAHSLLEDKAFIYGILSPQKNSLEESADGDPGHASITSGFDGFVPGMGKALDEQMQNIINVPLIVLVKQMPCSANEFIQLGCDCTSAYITYKKTTGTTKDGNKGYAIKITYDGPHQYYDVEDGPAILAD